MMLNELNALAVKLNAVASELNAVVSEFNALAVKLQEQYGSDGKRIEPAPQRPDMTPLSRFTLEGTKPKAMRFPDGSPFPIRYWRDILCKTVAWLADEGRLTAADCPVKTDRGAVLVSTNPSDWPVEWGTVEQVEGHPNLWMQATYSRKRHVQLARLILNRRGVDPETVFIG